MYSFIEPDAAGQGAEQTAEKGAREGEVGSVSLRGCRGHFAWATVNQLRAVTELLGESHDEAEDCAYLRQPFNSRVA